MRDIYHQMFRGLCDLNKKEDKNKFLHQRKIPIGTLKPPDDYENGNIPEDEIVWLYFHPKQQFNGAVLAWAGVGKTRFLKRLVYYFYHNDYDIQVYDPKHIDWVQGTKKGDGERLIKGEIKDKLPIYYCAPSFTVEDLPYNIREIYTDKHIYTHELKDMKSMIEWSTLGIYDYQVASAVVKAAKRFKTIDQIAKAIQHMGMKGNDSPDAIFSSTAKSLNTKLMGLKEFGLFSDKYKSLDIEKLWKEKKIIACSYFSKDETFMQLDVGKNIQKIKDIRENERKIKPLMQIFDDANFYVNNTLNQTRSISLKNAINGIIAWRSLGYNNIFCIQNPKKLHEHILDECKHLFISSMGSYDGLAEYISKDALNVLRRGLYSNEKRYTHQWMWYRPDRSFVLFYPLGCIVGH